MSQEPQSNATTEEAAQQRRKELWSYVLGTSLALLLTCIPFGAVFWKAMTRFDLFVLVGVCGLSQILVHFRFFLHISFDHQREDLLLILFSTLLLVIMVAGTLWIMGNLAQRMGVPGASEARHEAAKDDGMGRLLHRPARQTRIVRWSSLFSAFASRFNFGGW